MSNMERFLIEAEDFLWKLVIVVVVTNQIMLIWDVQKIKQEIQIHEEMDSFKFPVPLIQTDVI